MIFFISVVCTVPLVGHISVDDSTAKGTRLESGTGTSTLVCETGFQYGNQETSTVICDNTKTNGGYPVSCRSELVYRFVSHNYEMLMSINKILIIYIFRIYYIFRSLL